MNIKSMSVAFAAATAFAAAATAIAAGDDTYRESYPRARIDPGRGVNGDIGFSDTLPYWRNAEEVERNAKWIGDPNEQWKLNWKFMDLDRVDLHPGHLAVDEGAAMVAARTRQDPAFLTCLAGGGAKLEGQAASHPRYDPTLGRILTVEGRIEHCAKSVLNENLGQGTPANNKIAVYIKSLSTGTPIRADIGDGKLMAAYRRGEDLFYRKIGQLNFACASCHLPGSIMGHKLRGETPTTPFGDAAHYPTYRTPVGALESIQERFSRCLSQMRAQPLGPGDPAYVDLEVFLTVLSNDYPVSVPSAR